ncbi:MAG: D-alanyl-D-alanine carboxypeptidase, partial [Bdellovibrionales bacterium]|nr:D-alanyl-D-alanine carboxypeptidase [Bdellovibrionales bacterium]
LSMGAEQYGAPATVAKGARALSAYLEQKVGWKNFQVTEGAGLSRNNRATPRQLVRLLRHFEPNQGLLPVERKHYRAKTGTLTGVSTLIGYFNRGNGTVARFAVLTSGRVTPDYRYRVADSLRQCLL